MNDRDHFSELSAPLPSYVDRDLVRAVVRGIRRGHAITAAAYNEDEGWDGHCYGTTAWRLSWHHAEEEVLAYSDLSKITRRGGTFRIWHEGANFSVYSGSSDPNWSVYSYDFDRSRGRTEVAEANSEQLSLFAHVIDHTELESTPDDALRDLSFVYVGSPVEGGCTDIYLGAPLVNDEREASWAWVRRIFGRDDTTEPSSGGPSPSKYARYDDGDVPAIDLSVIADDERDT